MHTVSVFSFLSRQTRPHKRRCQVSRALLNWILLNRFYEQGEDESRRPVDTLLDPIQDGMSLVIH